MKGAGNRTAPGPAGNHMFADDDAFHNIVHAALLMSST
jgi:hypothetical protein